MGSREHKVIVTLACAYDMARSVEEGSVYLLEKHHGKIIGYLTSAVIVGKTLQYEAVSFCPLPSNKTSYEISGARIEDLTQKVWTITSIERLTAVALVCKNQKPAHAESKIN